MGSNLCFKMPKLQIHLRTTVQHWWMWAVSHKSFPLSYPLPPPQTILEPKEKPLNLPTSYLLLKKFLTFLFNEYELL